MAFSRRFPRDVPGSPYAAWEELFLTTEEESAIEKEQRAANTQLMRECIADAKTLLADSQLTTTQQDSIALATTLFEKRASHTVYWKEERLKDRFDTIFHKKEITKNT